MDILLRQVHVIDPSSPFHQQIVDILIQSGFIAEIGKISKSVDKEVSIPGLHISPGWVDVFSNFGDPGYEFNETLETGTQAAAFGGYTDVMIVPNTSPVLHNKSGIEYIVQKSKVLPVNVHAIGAVTKNTEGKELAEMYDMHASGAAAFGDGIKSIQSSGIVLKALQYVKAINKTVIQLADDQSISANGLMNEGIISTALGLAGKPEIAEELMIARDIELTKYSDSKIHFTGISTAKSLELIKQAKKDGVAVTCSVTPYHLFYTEEDLKDYDTNLKVNPPLRRRKDRDALKQGLINGDIDCIATHHFPHHTDHKVVEFEHAKDGMIGLETSFAAVRSAVPELSLEKIIQLLSSGPRTIFDLPGTSIQANASASLSLFLPAEAWTVTKLHSKSNNSPFIGKTLTGKPIGIINKDKLFLAQ